MLFKRFIKISIVIVFILIGVFLVVWNNKFFVFSLSDHKPHHLIITTQNDQLKENVAETLDATIQSDNRISLNGKINNGDPKTVYYFEYGGNPVFLRFRTEKQKLPAKLGAFLYESLDDELSNLGTWLKTEYFKDGGQKGGFLRLSSFEEGLSLDNNHQPVMGNIVLMNYFFVSSLDFGEMKSFALGGGNADLRDANLQIALRGKDIKAEDFDMYFWFESQHNPELGFNDGWRRANWALKDYSLTKYLVDGKWHQVKINLDNNTNRWIYAGNNPEQGLKARRYAYRSLNDSLQNVNVDFLLILANVKTSKMGSIDIDEMLVEYRNNSLIFPNNGGVNISHPKSNDHVSTLTDGWRFGEGKMWKSVINPQSPLEFIYKLPKNSWIEKIQIHQHPQWPAKDVQVYISKNGLDYQLLKNGIMPEPVKGNENTSFLLFKGFLEQAVFIKFVVKSGYKAEYWGLGELEVFGVTDALQKEVDSQVYVNQDIRNIVVDNTYYYRLVVKTSKRTFYGKVKKVLVK